jgi:tRNA(Arg) A34 adenosine deaminase TadA
MDSAAAGGDFPIAAMLWYGDSVIGYGYNTVRQDTEAVGHAEVNAVRMAIRAYGVEGFKKLDRENLALVSTYEPCLMCRGLLSFYGIENVSFIGTLDMSHWWDSKMRNWQYDLQCREATESPSEDASLRSRLKEDGH